MLAQNNFTNYHDTASCFPSISRKCQQIDLILGWCRTSGTIVINGSGGIFDVDAKCFRAFVRVNCPVEGSKPGLFLLE